MPQLSIVIPATGLQEDLDDTLVAVLENRPPSCEILVPHSPAYQDPYDLDDEVAFVPSEHSDVASLINAGIARSRAEVIHLMLGGVLATKGWTDAVMQRFQQDQQLSAAAPLLLNPARPHRVLVAGVRYLNRGVKQLAGRGAKRDKCRPSRTIDGPPLQAAFFRRATLETIGPITNRFGNDNIETDVAARLRAYGMRCELVTDSRLLGIHAERRRGFRAAQSNELVYWHHRGLSGHFSTLSHGCHVAADVMRHLPYPDVLTACLGRGIGWMQSIFQPRHQYDGVPNSTVLNFTEERSKVTAAHEEGPSKQYRRSA